MAIYFIDYENVGSTGIENVDRLDEDNVVHIFYSKKAETMKIEQVIQLMNVKAKVEFHDVTMRGQKNALDFQLIAMLYFTKKDEETCYIISMDQGYDAAIAFGRKIGAGSVYRCPSIMEAYEHFIKLRDKSARTQEKPVQEKEARQPAEEAAAAHEEPDAQEAVLAEQPQEAVLAERPQEAVSSQEKPAEAQEPEDSKPDLLSKQAHEIVSSMGTDQDIDDAKAEQMLAQLMNSKEAANLLHTQTQLGILQNNFGGIFDYEPTEEFYVDGGEQAWEAEEEKMNQAQEETKAEPAEPAQADAGPTAGEEQAQEEKAQEEPAQPEQAREPEQAQADQPQEQTQSRPKNHRNRRGKRRQKAETDVENAGSAEEHAGQGSQAQEEAQGGQTSRLDWPQFQEKVTEVMKAGGFDLPDDDCRLIGEALRTTKNKNQFYQFFRKKKGEAAGREFYLNIRGQYENLKVLRDI